jgi:hypothetical protein
MENLYPHLKYPHTQTIYFDNGEQRVLRNVKHVESGKWTHISCENEHGVYEVIINPNRVLFIKVQGE